MKNLLLISFLFFSTLVYSQYYYTLTAKADSCYTAGNYLQSQKFYTQAFNQRKCCSYNHHFFNAAFAFIKTSNYDTAFLFLNQAIEKGFAHTADYQNDSNLLILQTDIRWKELMSKCNEIKNNKNIEYQLALDKLIKVDINENDSLTKLLKKTKQPSCVRPDSVKSAKLVHDLDSLVLKYGWPTLRSVGMTSCSDAFMIVQHSNLETQLRYLPIIEKAAKNGDLRCAQLGLLIDVILKSQGKPQIYGSQMFINEKTGKWELYPIEDEINVNIRRDDFCFMYSIEDYVKHWGIEYKPPKKRWWSKLLRKK